MRSLIQLLLLLALSLSSLSPSVFLPLSSTHPSHIVKAFQAMPNLTLSPISQKGRRRPHLLTYTHAFKKRREREKPARKNSLAGERRPSCPQQRQPEGGVWPSSRKSAFQNESAESWNFETSRRPGIISVYFSETLEVTRIISKSIIQHNNSRLRGHQIHQRCFFTGGLGNSRFKDTCTE